MPRATVLAQNTLIQSGRGTGPDDAAATSITPAQRPTGARCQCLTDEQPRAVLRSRRSRARRGQRRCTHRPTEEDRTDGPRARPAMSGVRPRVRGRPDLHVRVVLRPARGRLRLRRDRARRSAARRSPPGPLSIWRYADLLPVDRNPAVDLGAGFTPLVRADRLAAELGLGEVWVKNDTAQPDELVQGPGRRRSRCRKALEFGFKVAACASTGNLANSVAAHAAHAGLRSYVFIPAEPRAGQDRHHRGLRRQRRRDRRQLRRREPAVRRARRHVPVGVRERERAHRSTPRARRRSRSRPPSSSAGRRPTTSSCPIASGSLLTKIRKGFDELHKVGLLDEEPQVRVSGAQAARVLAGRDRVARRAPTRSSR